MRRLTALEDDELTLEIVIGDKTVRDNAAQLQVVYSEASGKLSLKDRYEQFRQSLSIRWGVEVNADTAFLVLEETADMTHEAKKKHCNSDDSKSLESTPPENPPKG
jgi:hypothetical protein